MHAHHGAGADVGEEGTERDLLRADGDVDAAVAFHQFRIGRAVDQCDHARTAHALGQHGREDVGFVVVGERAIHIGLIDVLLAQQVFIGAVTHQHDRVLKFFGDGFGTLLRALQNLDAEFFFQRPCQRYADVAAAGDQDAAHRFVLGAQCIHHRADVAAVGEEEHVIVGFDVGRCLGNDRVAMTIDGGHAHIGAGWKALAHLPDGGAFQQAAARDANRDHLNLSLGKIQYLQGAGVFDQALHVFAHERFRADRHVYGSAAPGGEFGMLEVLGLAQARDLGGCLEQRIGDLAGDEIDFIAGGDGDDEFRIARAGVFQHARQAGMAEHGADIQFLGQVAQALYVVVHHGDVAVLAGQCHCH